MTTFLIGHYFKGFGRAGDFDNKGLWQRPAAFENRSNTLRRLSRDKVHLSQLSSDYRQLFPPEIHWGDCDLGCLIPSNRAFFC